MATFTTEASEGTVGGVIKKAFNKQKGGKPTGVFLVKSRTSVVPTDFDVLGDKIELLGFPSDCRLLSASVTADGEYDTGGSALRMGLIVDDGVANSATSGAGVGASTQASNDGLEVVSSSTDDTTQTITVWYTTNGDGDTVSTETKALNGTSQVAFTDTDVQLVLGVELSAATAGDITLREASGNSTIVSITAGGTTSGVTNVDVDAYDRTVSIVASGSTTKQIGLVGTNSDGTTIYDSQALTGAAAVLSNARFQNVSKILGVDLESSRTVTVTSTDALLVTGSQAFTSLPIPLNFTGGSLPGTEIGMDVSNQKLALLIEAAPTTGASTAVEFTTLALVQVGEIADAGLSEA